MISLHIIAGSLTTPPLGPSASSASLMPPKFPAGQGTTRIADQTIEEVDEQLTIQSIRGYDKRPTAQSLFASNNEKPPARSSPIEMPGSHHNNDKISYERIQSVVPDHQPYLFPNNEVFSTSAPEENTILNSVDISKPSTPATANKDGNLKKIKFTVSIWLNP